MTELGETLDPRVLIPGDPAGIAEVAGRLYNYATLLNEAGNGLARIDTQGGWQGAAADAFRAKFRGRPDAWLEAGACFLSAARALDDYVPVLSWAQREASEAITQWHAGSKQAALTILAVARHRVADAGETAASVIGRARDQAPQRPGFWSEVGGFLQSALHKGETLGADAVDGLASMGNAVISNPGDDAGTLAGLLLGGVSAIGDAGGTALDATGGGAVIGVPANALSTSGVLAGGTLAAASMGDLASHAEGDDRADPFKTGGDGSAQQDPRLVPGTPEYEEHIEELSKDPSQGGNAKPKNVREAVVAVQAEADGDIPGPLIRTPFDAAGEDQGDFTDSTGQKWEVKSSPDVNPDYTKAPGEPISDPQSKETFTDMVNKELGKGMKVLLDPHGMTPTRLAYLQRVVASNTEWQGQVIWGR